MPGKPKVKKQAVYLAAPLFSLPERIWNRKLARTLARTLPGVKVHLPQDFKVAGSYNDKRHWGDIFHACISAIDESDAVLAVVDGPDVDSGTAFEIGYAYKAGKPVLAVRTDFRQSQDRGLNIMLSDAAEELMVRMSFDEDPEKLAAEIARRLNRLLQKGA